ncbi:MAG TPA: DNA-directed RNA polymerase subunit L [Thermococcus sp.]|uniref:DNA-directed RNA polymerase subunit L n=1 Tax=Thermococcus sp. TaxID=35749 RepID=UPI000F25A3BF|nr:DNA-directed RNA polymerase subunit L [Thermococcus sp.]RLF78831.1 MAG: DNA-directed RNA polymerase subunit L [Thermococci archaeon]MCD6139455.1 DNA-directed RNA polymerase subunit L [Thermococcus sp.]MCD6144280.1 DNA-directed RNA polymerase subunit L [Thermococcus sp.]RLF85144.1 MAG: DNA-directed RNA polymerase subunit L [Thermococci archaeon]RLF86911.1 MAG: DNA-directed RNA polymerase subunit L [Thermococci archaeon]
MKIEVIKRDKNLLEFYLVGEDHTFANLLNETLHENKHVTFAAYAIEHPVLMARKPRFRISTDGKVTPEKALEEAAQKIFDRAKDVLEVWEGVIKK